MPISKGTGLVLKARQEDMMLENQIIGISGVFFLTFCLIALYHIISALGRYGRRSRAQIAQITEPRSFVNRAPIRYRAPTQNKL
jgi:hypothetical protein